jgi:hypothetical protein
MLYDLIRGSEHGVNVCLVVVISHDIHERKIRGIGIYKQKAYNI